MQEAILTIYWMSIIIGLMAVYGIFAILFHILAKSTKSNKMQSE